MLHHGNIEDHGGSTTTDCHCASNDGAIRFPFFAFVLALCIIVLILSIFNLQLEHSMTHLSQDGMMINILACLPMSRITLITIKSQVLQWKPNVFTFYNMFFKVADFLCIVVALAETKSHAEQAKVFSP